MQSNNFFINENKFISALYILLGYVNLYLEFVMNDTVLKCCDNIVV